MNKLIQIIAFVLVSGSIMATPDYYVKTNGTGDGSTWAAATDLRTALNQAQDGDEIWLWEGTYKTDELFPGTGCAGQPFMIRDGISIYGSFSGTSQTIATRSNLTLSIISGDDNSNGIVDFGESNSLFSIFATSSSTIVIDGLVFTLAKCGIDAIGCTLQVSNVEFTEISGEGAIKARTSDVEMEWCKMYDNDVVDNAGVLYIEESSVSIKNSSFNDNTKIGRKIFGGSVLKADDSEIQFVNCLFANNMLVNEYDFAEVPTGTDMEIVNCTFFNNELAETGASEDAFDAVEIRNSIMYNDGATYRDDVLTFLTNTTATLDVDYSNVPSSYGGSGTYLTTSDPNMNTSTMQLTSSSTVCIDFGLNTANGTAVDLNDDSRLSRPTALDPCVIDLGAFEYQVLACSNKRNEAEDETIEDAIGLYPNPTRGSFFISAPEGITSVFVKDAAGRLMKSESYIGDENTLVNLDISGNAAGYYFIEVRSEHKSWTEKIILQ